MYYFFYLGLKFQKSQNFQKVGTQNFKFQKSQISKMNLIFFQDQKKLVEKIFFRDRKNSGSKKYFFEIEKKSGRKNIFSRSKKNWVGKNIFSRLENFDRFFRDFEILIDFFIFEILGSDFFLYSYFSGAK